MANDSLILPPFQFVSPSPIYCLASPTRRRRGKQEIIHIVGDLCCGAQEQGIMKPKRTKHPLQTICLEDWKTRCGNAVTRNYTNSKTKRRLCVLRPITTDDRQRKKERTASIAKATRRRKDYDYAAADGSNSHATKRRSVSKGQNWNINELSPPSIFENSTTHSCNPTLETVGNHLRRRANNERVKEVGR